MSLAWKNGSHRWKEKSKLSCKRLFTSLSPGKSHLWHGTCAGGWHPSKTTDTVSFQEEHANWNCHWLPRSSLFKYRWTWILRMLFLHPGFVVVVFFVPPHCSTPNCVHESGKCLGTSLMLLSSAWCQQVALITLLTSEQHACTVAAHTMQSARDLSQSSPLLYLTLRLVVYFIISRPGQVAKRRCVSLTFFEHLHWLKGRDTPA